MMPNKMRLIGITGGVGSGKTEILRFIKKHYNCKIYMADEVAHEVQMPGGLCYEKLIALLGKGVLAEDGTFDRVKVATKIFLDRGLLTRVNSIVHPAVNEYLANAVEEAKREGTIELFFIEAALLLETGYKQFVDEMWYIYSKESVRRRRLIASRQYSDEKITQIMGSQLSEEEFRRGCDFVVDNSGSLEQSFKQIMDRLEAYSWQ